MNDRDVLRVAVIMAGGSGERFWPLSRKDRPKQLLRLADPQKTLLEQSIERIEPIVPRERVFVATARHLRDAVITETRGFPSGNVLCEPCKRNTAGALVYAAACLLSRFGKPERLSMAVLTADHRIADVTRFRQAAAAALTVAENHSSLVVMGIRPTRPETGYGYIEVMEHAEPVWRSPDGVCVMRAAGFREKPDRETAEHFLKTGNFLWNSGMFFWRVDVFLDELRAASPEHADAVSEIAEAIRAGDETSADERFTCLPDISIDYALMEKSNRVAVVQAEFDWDDIGAWDALDRSYPKDAEGNVTVGDPVIVSSRNCIVYNHAGAENMAVGLVGCDNLAVIVSADGVLVVPKDRAQEVRKVVAELKRRGYTGV